MDAIKPSKHSLTQQTQPYKKRALPFLPLGNNGATDIEANFSLKENSNTGDWIVALCIISSCVHTREFLLSFSILASARQPASVLHREITQRTPVSSSYRQFDVADTIKMIASNIPSTRNISSITRIPHLLYNNYCNIVGDYTSQSIPLWFLRNYR